MSPDGEPFVWVVTPVHNGETYLGECIESVLAQTYGNWRYAVVDNRSTDRTAEVVLDYAARDARISLHQNTDFLPIMANWNHALSLLPPNAAYCKVVHADDTLLAECLQRMVAVAEANPSVGIVTSFAIWGREVRHDGYVPFPSEVVGGPEVCRSTLEGRCYLFGSPTSLLLRSDVVRARPEFYNEQNLHADTEACFDVLRTTDLGFVHQILTRTRIHEEAMTASYTSKVNTFHSGWLTILHRYGRTYLDAATFKRRWRRAVGRYGVFLAKAVVQGKFRDPAFRRHHRATMAYVWRAHRRSDEQTLEPPPTAGTLDG